MSSVQLPSELERHRVLPARAAAALCGYGYDHWLDLAKAGRVPAPIRFNARKFGWQAGVLLDWLKAQADKPTAA
jgi:predicted DNA-binding transcriptional regulator AlpA